MQMKCEQSFELGEANIKTEKSNMKEKLDKRKKL
jgi:hypothetical protein